MVTWKIHSELIINFIDLFYQHLCYFYLYLVLPGCLDSSLLIRIQQPLPGFSLSLTQCRWSYPFTVLYPRIIITRIAQVPLIIYFGAQLVIMSFIIDCSNTLDKWCAVEPIFSYSLCYHSFVSLSPPSKPCLPVFNCSWPYAWSLLDINFLYWDLLSILIDSVLPF